LAAFATRGAAPGPILAKLLLSCMVRLENANCEVVGVVMDGATTNKAAWKALGISGKAGSVVNKACQNHKYLCTFNNVQFSNELTLL